MADTPDAGARKRATAADVAARAQVSRATVGYVLNETPGQTISSATARRVREAARELHYQPHRSAQALARGASNVVLVVLASWPSAHSFSGAVESASAHLAAHGFALVTQVRQPEGVRPVWDSIEPLLVAGFVPFSQSELRSMRSAGIRHILSNPGLALGEKGGVSLQVGHLHRLGHRRLGFAGITDPRLADLSVARARLITTETTRLGLPQPIARSVNVSDGSADEAVSIWLDAGVTAVAAFDDESAAAVVRALHTRGLDAPHDLAVIGHDDSPLAQLFTPSLSSVAVDAEAYGRHLADIVLAAILDRQIETADGDFYTLIARDSTAATHRSGH